MGKFAVAGMQVNVLMAFSGLRIAASVAASPAEMA